MINKTFTGKKILVHIVELKNFNIFSSFSCLHKDYKIFSKDFSGKLQVFAFQKVNIVFCQYNQIEILNSLF